MPICEIHTNIKKDQVPADLQQQVSKLIVQTLPGKPEERVTVMIYADVQICRNGSNDPNMYMRLSAIGCFDEERNPTYSEKFLDFFNKKLNLSDDRIAISFIDLPPAAAARRPKSK